MELEFRGGLGNFVGGMNQQVSGKLQRRDGDAVRLRDSFRRNDFGSIDLPGIVDPGWINAVGPFAYRSDVDVAGNSHGNADTGSITESFSERDVDTST